MNYKKRFISFQEQLDRLIERGMKVEDKESAFSIL